MSDPKIKAWRSLAELEQTPEFLEFMHREFPTAASELPPGLSRRRWMQLMGASFTLATFAGCRWPQEELAPFAQRPDGRIPGEPEQMATSIELCEAVKHLLVTCYDGRPIKVEGNPDHPASSGASDTYSQATILSLYDPDRSDTPMERRRGKSYRRSWSEVEQLIERQAEAFSHTQGKGLAILLSPSSSLAESQLLAAVLRKFPKAKLYRDAVRADQNLQFAAERVFGRSVRPEYDLTAAQRIVSFDCDLLGQHADALSMTRQFARGRDPDGAMNRLYVVESQFSITGSSADHRLPRKTVEIPLMVVELVRRVRLLLGQPETAVSQAFDEQTNHFLDVVAKDLAEHRGGSLVAVGSHHSPALHSLTMELNELLGNQGRTVSYYAEQPAPPAADLAQLSLDIETNCPETLLILGANPVYTAPGELGFAAALGKVPVSIHLGEYRDETGRLTTWHLPQTHPFEAWGDVRRDNGTISVTQPLIEPLHGGRSRLQILAQWAGDSREPDRIVRTAISGTVGGPLTDEAWERLLHDGFLAGSTSAAVNVAVDERFDHEAAEGEALAISVATPKESLEFVFALSDQVFDGRFANNGWLQETPHPLTKVTWDNAALMSPATASKLGVGQGSWIRLQRSGPQPRQVELPVYILPGQAEGSVGVALGYGRTSAGFVGGDAEATVESVGVDVGRLRDWTDRFCTTDLQLVALDREPYEFATTQDHHAIDLIGLQETGHRVGELVREMTHAEYTDGGDGHSGDGHGGDGHSGDGHGGKGHEKDGRVDGGHDGHGHQGGNHADEAALWEETSYDDRAWGMSIDLNRCVGCNACMVACQSENNVPVVGRDQVAKGREMHWLRIDRYFMGEPEQPQVATQPVACHHCENAPCEQVCPVAATVHSDEGLNDMIYNRCVGTRYCGNNCPYKVRRFNFLDYAAPLEEPGRELVQLSVNPEVTVRSRGVMEKCTYCVQRIQRGKIDAKTGNRPLEDGEIVTACQQACPAEAILFGDVNDKNSRVAQAHNSPRAYGMLEELNVKPRTRYLSRVRNPHPELTDHNA